MKKVQLFASWMMLMAFGLSNVMGADEVAPKSSIELAAPFRDNAILQREKPVPVWGWTKPGTKITVAFQGQTKSVTAGKDGSWLIKLDPLKASAEPAEMVIQGFHLRQGYGGQVGVQGSVLEPQDPQKD